MYDFFAFLKKDRLDEKTYIITKDNLYYLHSKRDKILNKNVGQNEAIYFKSKENYNLSPDKFFSRFPIKSNHRYIECFSFQISLTSPFFTASENKFYSIANPIAKERPTGLPVLKGSSLKGALRQAAVDNIENELIDKNYGDIFKKYSKQNVDVDEIIETEESKGKDKFFFEKRAQLVKLFGNEKDTKWFTFKSLIATGGIKNVNKVRDILEKINNAFEHYLKKSHIVNSEGVCRGRLIFEDFHFKKIGLDVITPLKREKRTPVRGPIFYEVVPEGVTVTGTLIWFPFDLIARGELDRINEEWEKDKEIVKEAFKKLAEKGIGAKTKAGWGRFTWEEQ